MDGFPFVAKWHRVAQLVAKEAVTREYYSANFTLNIKCPFEMNIEASGVRQ